MKITWDKKAKAVYIYLTEEELKITNTTKISEDVYLDFTYVNLPIGIEILNVEEIPVVEQIGG